MRAIKALAALLLYPQHELVEALETINRAIEEEPSLPRDRIVSITSLVTQLQQGNLLDLQESYVELFDTTPSHSLHLFHHLYGDAHERGRALTDLLDLYRLNGYRPASNELPDYLPMFCEFVAQLPRSEAKTLLGTALPVFEILERRLAEQESAYASVFAALAALAEPSDDTALVAKMLQSRSAGGDKPRTLDEAWAEPVVDFKAPVIPPGSEHVIPVAPPQSTSPHRRERNR